MPQEGGTQSPGGKGAQEVGGTDRAGAEKEEGDRRPGKGSSLEGRHQQKEREGTGARYTQASWSCCACRWRCLN